MRPLPLRFQQLQAEDRMTIASLGQQNFRLLATARQVQRAPSTVLRELQRNSDAKGYGIALAQPVRVKKVVA